VEMQWPVHGIDGGDHAVNAKVMLEHGIRYHRKHQRCGVCQTRRFDHDTPERGYDATLIAIQQRSEGLHQLLPHRAADAAMTQEDGLLIKALDQMVIEPHLAKLVDQYGGVMQLWAGQETSQQGCLPTPEKPRDDGDRSCGGAVHTPGSRAACGWLSCASS